MCVGVSLSTLAHTRTDSLYDVYDLYDLFLVDGLAISGRSIPDLYDLYDLARVAGSNSYNLY